MLGKENDLSKTTKFSNKTCNMSSILKIIKEGWRRSTTKKSKVMVKIIKVKSMMKRIPTKEKKKKKMKNR